MRHQGLAQRDGVISPLEKRDDPAPGDFPDQAGHLGEMFGFQQLVPKGIQTMGIEARGNEQKIGGEKLQLGHDHAPDRVGPLVRAASRRHLHVQVGVTFSPFVGKSRSRKLGVFVQADEEHRVIIIKGVLRAITVMDIEIKNSHPVRFGYIADPSCRDGDVVEHAEPHRVVGLGMMPRGGASGQRRSRTPRPG